MKRGKLTKAEVQYLLARPYRITRKDTGTLIYASGDVAEARRHLKKLRQSITGIVFEKHGF